MTCPDCEFSKHSYDKTCESCEARAFARMPRGVLRTALAQRKKEMSAEDFEALRVAIKAWYDKDKSDEPERSNSQ